MGLADRRDLEIYVTALIPYEGWRVRMFRNDARGSEILYVISPENAMLELEFPDEEFLDDMRQGLPVYAVRRIAEFVNQYRGIPKPVPPPPVPVVAHATRPEAAHQWRQRRKASVIEELGRRRIDFDD